MTRQVLSQTVSTLSSLKERVLFFFSVITVASPHGPGSGEVAPFFAVKYYWPQACSALFYARLMLVNFVWPSRSFLEQCNLSLPPSLLKMCLCPGQFSFSLWAAQSRRFGHQDAVEYFCESTLIQLKFCCSYWAGIWDLKYLFWGRQAMWV